MPCLRFVGWQAPERRRRCIDEFMLHLRSFNVMPTIRRLAWVWALTIYGVAIATSICRLIYGVAIATSICRFCVAVLLSGFVIITIRRERRVNLLVYASAVVGSAIGVVRTYVLLSLWLPIQAEKLYWTTICESIFFTARNQSRVRYVLAPSKKSMSRVVCFRKSITGDTD
jgi:hypothetical protein